MFRHTLRLALVLAATAGSAAADDRMEYVGHHTPTFFTHWLDVEIVGDRAYVVGFSGFSVFDIGAAGAPLFLGRSPGPRQYAATASTPLSYATAREQGIFVVDAGATPPVRVSQHLEPGTSFESVVLDGDLLYATAHHEGLLIYDVTDPRSFRLVGRLRGFDNAWAVVKQGDWLAVADAAAGLRLVDVRDPSRPLLAATVPTSGTAQDVAWKEATAYVATGSGGVDIVDLTHPARPVVVANQPTPSGPAFHLAVDPASPRIYVATWQLVEVIDVSDPARPVRIGFEDTPARAMGVAAGPDLVYVADWSTFNIYRFGPTREPDISVSPSFVSFPVVPVGESADTTLTIANTGGRTLKVSDVQITGADFAVDGTAFQVPPGGTARVRLTVTPAHAQGAGELSIVSDDPDESGRGHALDYGTVGTVAPDFRLDTLDRTRLALSDLAGEVVVLAFFASW